MPAILIVDDDAASAAYMEAALGLRGHAVSLAGDGASGLARLEETGFDLALVDIGLPDMSGLEVMDRLAALAPELGVIIVTADASGDTAVQALRRGALDYLVKPVDQDELLLTVERLLELGRLKTENRELRRRLHARRPEHGLLSVSPSMAQVLKRIEKIAQFDTTVLLSGPSGAGKSLAARAIHQQSPRAEGPLVEVNCGAIPETLLESELFGYKKGAFTGAQRDKAGFFSQAQGGTLFLDEVGELPLALQVKLLHAVQECRITPLGATASLPLDFRLVTATNRDLTAEVAAGRFRQDLFYRLNVFEISLPALGQRREDIPMLAQRFLRQAGQRLGKELSGLEREAMQALMAYPWPGNVRELENVIEGALVLAEGERLALADLPPRILGLGVQESASEMEPLRKASARFERQYLERAIEAMDGDREAAAQALGINLATLYRKLKR